MYCYEKSLETTHCRRHETLGNDVNVVPTNEKDKDSVCPENYQSRVLAGSPEPVGSSLDVPRGSWEG